MLVSDAVIIGDELKKKAKKSLTDKEKPSAPETDTPDAES